MSDASKTTAVDTGLEEQADRFLVWHSGWYTGSAKKRGFNLAGIAGAVHAVVDYCKSNRDKKLAQVMDLMLKR